MQCLIHISLDSTDSVQRAQKPELAFYCSFYTQCSVISQIVHTAPCSGITKISLKLLNIAKNLQYCGIILLDIQNYMKPAGNLLDTPAIHHYIFLLTNTSLSYGKLQTICHLFNTYQILFKTLQNLFFRGSQTISHLFYLGNGLCLRGGPHYLLETYLIVNHCFP